MILHENHLTKVKLCQFVLMKIIEIAATRWHILKLRCTKFDFGWAPPQTPLEELTALPRPSSWISGPISKGKERWKQHMRKGRGGEGIRIGEEKEGNGE